MRAPRSRRRMRWSASAMISTLPYCEGAMAAEPNSKLIDWMSIERAMRRRSGRRLNSRMVTRSLERSFFLGAASSCRSMVAAEGVVACANARLGMAIAAIAATANIRRVNMSFLLQARPRNAAGQWQRQSEAAMNGMFRPMSIREKRPPVGLGCGVKRV
ncbi:exported hypothetical protein [Mesorhizobium sp. ORS 3359]|nr:exported hypothetical protein [Mesorhizobium sp. ORS 3359]